MPELSLVANGQAHAVDVPVGASLAPTPWTLAGEEELRSATPLPGTEHELPVARTLVRRALAALSPR
jgi:hypothetical protein